MRGRYSFWTYVLSCLVAVLAITSYFIPQPGEWEVWILGALSNALIVVSVMAINTKSVNNVFNPALTSIFLLLVMLLNPKAACFSPLHPAVLLFVWSQYCFITKQKFLSMLFLAISALFYAPLALALPVVFIVSIFGAADIPRTAVKSLGGLLLPFVYVLCYRFMVHNDAVAFAEEYLHKAMAFSMPFRSMDMISLFMVLCITWVCLHAISNMFSKLHKNSIITEHILKMEFLCILLGASFFVLFGGDSNVAVNMVVALPIAFLLSHYFTSNINAASARIELILLCCAALVQRLSYFI